jgi:hypothetical protein
MPRCRHRRCSLPSGCLRLRAIHQPSTMIWRFNHTPGHTTPNSPLRQAGMDLSPPVVTPSCGSPWPQDGGRMQQGNPAAIVVSSTAAFPSVMGFIDSLKLPLQEPLIKTAPRPRQAHRIDDSVVPRHSDRLAAKSVFRDPQPEKQAKRVMMNKWRRRPEHAVSCTRTLRSRPSFTTRLRSRCLSSSPCEACAWRGLSLGTIEPPLHTLHCWSFSRKASC